jgi:hypothetical protein
MEIVRTKPDLRIKTFYIDGMGCRRDGCGSAYGWIRIETDVRRIRQVNGLTEGQAELHPLLWVLRYVAPGSRATIFTHSQIVWGYFNCNASFRRGLLKVASLFSDARQLIRQKKLNIRVRYILREDNRAVIAPDYRCNEDCERDFQNREMYMFRAHEHRHDFDFSSEATKRTANDQRK